MSIYTNTLEAFKAGMNACRNGVNRWDSPIDKRTHANLYQHWLDGWDRECKPHESNPCKNCGIDHDDVKSGKCN